MPVDGNFLFHVPYVWSAHKIIYIHRESLLANAHAINLHVSILGILA